MRGLRSLLEEMQPRTVLVFSLFNRQNSSVKASELGRVPAGLRAAVQASGRDDLRLFLVAALTSRTSILGVQFLKVCDLGAETPDLAA